MKHRDRVLMSLEHEQPDRCPMQVSFTPEFADRLRESVHLPSKTHHNPHGGGNTYELERALGEDMLLTSVGWANSYYANDSYNPGHDSYADEWGIVWRNSPYTTPFGQGFYTEIIGNPLAEDSAITGYKPPDPNRASLYDESRWVLETFKDEYWIVGVTVTTIFETAWALRGYERILMDFVTDPDLADAILDIPYRYHLCAAERLVRMGVDMIWIGDDVGTQHAMLMSPDTWRRFLKPRMASYIGALKRINPSLKVAYHSDGNVLPIIPELIEVGVDILNPVQPRSMDPALLKKKFGKQLCFWGSIDEQHTLPFGTADDVRKEVAQRLRTIGKGGGLIIGPTHHVQLDTPVDNVRALVEAVTGALLSAPAGLMADNKLNYNPLYLQVKDVLMRRIVDGQHKPGELLPSESRLAADFGTSVSTIRQALSLLVADGILVKKQGKGTLVSERKVHVSFLSWMGETRRGEEILNGVVRMFEQKYPPIAIDVIPTTYPETRTTLTRLISSGRAPDVAQIVSHWTSYFASAGAFQPLEGLLSRDNMAFRLPGQDLFGGTFQNQVYSAAWGLCPIALIANRNVMRAAGVENLDSPMTLDAFQECCAKIGCIRGDAAPSAFGLWYTPGVENDYLSIYTFLQAFRGEFVDEDGNIGLDSPENISGFTWVRDFVAKTRIFTSDIFTIRNRFAANRIGFISDGPWIKYLLEEATGEPFEKNFQVVLNPVHANTESRSWTYNHAMAICAQSRNSLYAARFVDALTGDPELSAWYCSRVGILPPNLALLTAPEFKNAFFETFKEQLRHARAIDARNPMFERAMVICVDAVKKILFEGANIQKELSEKEYYLKMLYDGS